MASSNDLDHWLQETMSSWRPSLMPAHGQYFALSPGEHSAGSLHRYPAGDGDGFPVS